MTVRPCALLLLASVATAQEVPPPPPSPVPGLVAMLDSDDAAIRRAAAERLAAVRGGGFAGPPAETAIPPLLQRFEVEHDDEAASATAFALVELGPAPAAALAFLAARLPAWREGGAPPAALEGIGAALRVPANAATAAAVVPLLTSVLRESPCRHGALAVLLVLGGDRAAALPALQDLLRHADAGERWRALAMLACVGGAAPESAVQGLEDADPQVRFWSAQALLRSELDPVPARAVVPWLDDGLLPVRRRAIAAAARLREVQANALQSLVAALADAEVAATAGEALVRLGPRAAPAVPALGRLMEATPEAGDHDPRVLAVRALGAVGRAAAPAVPALVELVAGSDPAGELPAEAGAALARIAPALAVTSLMHLWERDVAADSDSWWSSAMALAAMGAAAAPELPRFLAAIERGPRAATANALRVLAAFGPQARPALPAVLRVLECRDQWTAWLAKDALLAMQVDGSEVMPALQRAFEQDPLSRASLLQGLHRLGAAAEPLLLAAMRSGDPTVVMVAEPELVSLPSPSPAAVAAMIERLASATELPMRMSAGRQLAHCLEERPVVAEALVAQLPPLLDHEDFHVFEPVAKVLARTLRPAVAAAPEFELLLAAAPDRAAVRKALADEAALAAWIRARGREREPGVRAAAAALLPLLEAGVDANLALLDALAMDPEPVVRAAAMAAMPQAAEARHRAPTLDT